MLMFKNMKLFRHGFEHYVCSLGVKTYKYGNATHAYGEILDFICNKTDGALNNILLPSYLPAKLYRITLACGFTPKSYSIDRCLNFDTEEIKSLIDRGTKAIFAIHYFGYPAKIKELREIADRHHLILIEDCAHVIYAREAGRIIGTWGDFAIFSSRKMLILPEGGYLVLNKKFTNFVPAFKHRVNSLHTIMKLLQSRGKNLFINLCGGKDILSLIRIPLIGYIDFNNIGSSQSKKISLISSLYSKIINVGNVIEKRRCNYSYLFNGIKTLHHIRPVFYECPHTWTPYSFPALVGGGARDLLQQQLAKSGICCGAGWPESPFEKRIKKTCELSGSLIEFPIHPLLGKRRLDKILTICRNFEKVFERDQNETPVEEVSIDKPEVSEIQLYDEEKNDRSDDPIPERKSGLDRRKFFDGELKAEVIRTTVQFDNIRTDWDELCDNSDTNVFQTFEWQWLWWKYFGIPNQLYLILFYFENYYTGKKILVGAAPFFIDSKYLGGINILNRLKFIGSGVDGLISKRSNPEYGVTDYLDLIVRKGYGLQVVNALADYLILHYGDYDAIQLDEVNSDSIVIKELLPVLRSKGLKFRISRREICPSVHLDKTLDGYLSKLNTKVRYQLRKILKDLEANDIFVKREILSSENLRTAFDDFVSIHQAEWNEKGLPGLFSNESFRKFLEDVGHSFLKKGYLHFTTLYTNDKCLAAEYGFRYKNRYYDYLKAFDIRSPYTKFRPGKALLLLLIQNAIDNSAATVELLRGAESYKFDFTSSWLWTYRLTIANPVTARNFRYSLFLLIRLLGRVKYRILNQALIIETIIKNSGLAGLTGKYIPSTTKKIKEKLGRSLFRQDLSTRLSEHEIPDNNLCKRKYRKKTKENYGTGGEVL
jgi:dTDP-4-amino-4,6-dideoxygalactose transaminase/CelD/BcsL family acetyltransferase involved in cellulose biosynthesis